LFVSTVGINEKIIQELKCREKKTQGKRGLNYERLRL